MFIKLTNGVPTQYTIGQLRRDNPQTSFPKDVPNEILASYDVYPVKRVPAPPYNELTQFIRVVDPVQIDGVWTQQWEKLDLPVAQQIENLKAARATAYAEEADPLFFKAQRDEAELTEWEAKVQEIRDRFPYPEEQLIN
jgi:hypothetical protein